MLTGSMRELVDKASASWTKVTNCTMEVICIHITYVGTAGNNDNDIDIPDDVRKL